MTIQINKKIITLFLSVSLLTSCFDMSPNPQPIKPKTIPAPQQVIPTEESMAIKLPEGISAEQLPQFDLAIPPNSTEHQLPDGSRYIGLLHNGAPQGIGQFYPAQQPGVVIISQFANGRIIGTTRYINQSVVYTGRLNPRTLQPHGYGISIANGSRYQGFFNSGLMEGDGELKYQNGTTFKGEFIQGQPNKGKLTTANKEIYEGTFNNGLLTGSATYPDGRKEEVENKKLF